MIGTWHIVRLGAYAAYLRARGQTAGLYAAFSWRFFSAPRADLSSLFYGVWGGITVTRMIAALAIGGWRQVPMDQQSKRPCTAFYSVRRAIRTVGQQIFEREVQSSMEAQPAEG